VFGMGTGVALWVWAPTNPSSGLFIRMKVLVFRQSIRDPAIESLIH
jgi:hypothetical protein